MSTYRRWILYIGSALPIYAPDCWKSCRLSMWSCYLPPCMQTIKATDYSLTLTTWHENEGRKKRKRLRNEVKNAVGGWIPYLISEDGSLVSSEDSQINGSLIKKCKWVEERHALRDRVQMTLWGTIYHVIQCLQVVQYMFILYTFYIFNTSIYWKEHQNIMAIEKL